MVLKVIGSSSTGNCYILDNGNEAIILEAGIKILDVKKALGWNLHKVVGCLITHQHADHSKYMKQMIDCGFHVMALPEVWDHKHLNSHRAIFAKPGKGYQLGGFKVLPFPACHDVPCVGFIIAHKDIGRLMFLTDSFMCEYTFPGINHVMIECNYSDSLLSQSIIKGNTYPAQKKRLLTSHMELNTCINTIKANDISKLEDIILIHLSKDNGDPHYFLEQVERQLGKAVYCAYPGMELELNKKL
jgi:phosphoribosyl 1,2-cyclic phosphodiesterase